MPEVSDFKSFFSNEICPRKDDLKIAISFYESLSDEEIERRLCIQYWEDCALGTFDALYDEVTGNFYRSIDNRELARREIKNIELLLNEGTYQMMPNKEYLLINEIPAMYEKLITGTWSEFLIAHELESYENAQEENSQKYFDALAEIRKKDKENIQAAQMEPITNSIKKYAGPLYIDYFNFDWIAAMQIQALIWYKAAIEKIMTDGTCYLTGLAERVGRNILAEVKACL